MNTPRLFVFHDPEGKRWERFRWIGLALLVLLSLAGSFHVFASPADSPELLREATVWTRAVSAEVERLFWIGIGATTIGLFVRGTLVVTLATLHSRRTSRPLPTDRAADRFAPPVSVLIAAYNEEKVIRATLQSVLHTDYPGPLEIIVVDDGSTDGTARVVAAMARQEPRIHLRQQANRGKSLALRHAVEAATHEMLVFLDADTHFQHDTLRHLLLPMADDRIGAVSGTIRVGNPCNFLTRCQALEYACGFNLDRRAYALWNGITVVPGAVSAIRRRALEEAGGFSVDTLAEDTDLTLCLHRTGWRIEASASAIAWTEAPETLSALARQRLRWAFGTLQCLWKHRTLSFNPAYGALGLFSLPSVWFCQIFLVALMPLIDLLLLHGLIAREATELLLWLALFLVYDLALAIYACVLDGEPVSKAWRILPMRLFYRPLLSWVVLRSLFKALRGAWVAWDKLDRSAGVETARPSLS